MEACKIGVGTVIRDYEFLEPIGSGGFSKVFKVKSARFDRLFAAKVITTKGNADRAWQAFDTEVSALVLLDHPNIIRLYDRFRVGNQFVLILEYCPRGSLGTYIRTHGPLKGSTLLTVVVDLISALAYSWKKGVAHKDIKPENILIDDFGRIKLADFGISATDDVCSDFRCSTAFAAPEVLARSPHNPIKSDVWSTGMTILALTGAKIASTARSYVEIERHVLLLLNACSRRLDFRLKRLVERMLVVAPRNRIDLSELTSSEMYKTLKDAGKSKRIVCEIHPRKGIEAHHSSNGSELQRSILYITLPKNPNASLTTGRRTKVQTFASRILV